MNIRLNKKLRQENGFTLPELLVVILMLTVVLFGLYSIFDMSLRVFSYGNDKVEATENARVALERMEREMRMAYAYNKPDKTFLLCASGNADCSIPSNANQVAFGNDLNGDQKVLNCSAPASCSGELISFTTDANGNGITEANEDILYRRLRFNPEQVAPGDALANLGDNGTLKFEYFKEDGTTEVPPPLNATTETEVRVIRIQITVRVDRGTNNEVTQTLSTDVSLRNRGR